MNQQDEFKTSDIVMAATLSLEGYEIIRIECTGNKGTFVFKGVGSNFIHEFDLGQKLVEPVAFNTTIRRLTTAVKREIGTSN